MPWIGTWPLSSGFDSGADMLFPSLISWVLHAFAFAPSLSRTGIDAIDTRTDRTLRTTFTPPSRWPSGAARKGHPSGPSDVVRGTITRAHRPRWVADGHGRRERGPKRVSTVRTQRCAGSALPAAPLPRQR